MQYQPYPLIFFIFFCISSKNLLFHIIIEFISVFMVAALESYQNVPTQYLLGNATSNWCVKLFL